MYSNIAGLLAEEMGLGKTLETLAGFDEGTLSFVTSRSGLYRESLYRV